jgi:hypothetical protein
MWRESAAHLWVSLEADQSLGSTYKTTNFLEFMARPKISTTEKRTAFFTFRVTQAQRDRLQILADYTGCYPGDLIRAKLFSGRFPRVKMARIDLTSYTELKKIGVNINQLAKHANSGMFPYGIKETLINLKRQEHQIINLCLLMIASQKIGKSFMGALKYNWNKLFNLKP